MKSLITLAFIFVCVLAYDYPSFPPQYEAAYFDTEQQATIKIAVDTKNQRARIDKKSLYNSTAIITKTLAHIPEKSVEATVEYLNQGYWPGFSVPFCAFNIFDIVPVAQQQLNDFPKFWYYENSVKVQSWVEIPSDLSKTGEEVVDGEKTWRWDSAKRCKLRIQGNVPCFSAFVRQNDSIPIQIITAHQRQSAFDEDKYIITKYNFTYVGQPEESLFNLPEFWQSTCVSYNMGFSFSPVRGFVATPTGSDNFTVVLQAPPNIVDGDFVYVDFKPVPDQYFTCSYCVTFNPPYLMFDSTNWDVPQFVSMNFERYGKSNYKITGHGGGYDQLETLSKKPTFAVYTCNGTPGLGCDK